MTIKNTPFIARVVIFCTLFISVVEINAPVVVYGFQILGFISLIALAYISRPRISTNLLFVIFIVNVFILLLAVRQFSYLEFKGIFWLNTLRTLFWINSSILLYNYLSNYIGKIAFTKVINCIILISSLSVYIQFLSFYLFHIEIDFSFLLGGDGVRSNYGGFEGIPYRPTGLTSEPAIHSGIMIGLLTLYYIFDNKIKFISILALGSILLTFSTLGVLLVLFYIIIIYTKRIRSMVFAIFLVGIISLFLLDSLIARYETFISGTDTSNNIKYEIIENLFSNFDFILTGFGFVGKDSDAPHFYEALYDMTYFFTPNIYFGLFWGNIIILLSLFFLYKSSFSLRENLLISLSFIKLSGPTFMFFNFFIMFLFLLHKKREE